MEKDRLLQKPNHYGEKFAYLCKLSNFFLNFKTSCLGYKKDTSVVIDEDIEYSKSDVIEMLNEYFMGQYRIVFKYEMSTALKRYEVDMAQLILTFRECYAVYKIRQTISTHLLWHAGDRLIRFNRNESYGLGVENCSAFESVHQIIKTKIKHILSKVPDSEPYRDQLCTQINQYNDIHLYLSSNSNLANENEPVAQLGDED